MNRVLWSIGGAFTALAATSTPATTPCVRTAAHESAEDPVRYPVAPPPRAISPDPQSLIVPSAMIARAQSLVARLASRDAATREGAETELARMGRLARPALLAAALAHPDPTVRERCGGLLPRATEDELAARLRAFQADTEGRFEHDVPGTRTFLKKVGGTPEVRALAVAVLKDPAHRLLFKEVERGYRAGGRALVARRAELHAQMWPKVRTDGGSGIVRHPTLEEVAAVLVAELVIRSDDCSPDHLGYWIQGSEFIASEHARAVVEGAGRKEVAHFAAFRSVAGKWIESRDSALELSQLDFAISGYMGAMPEACTGWTNIAKATQVDASTRCHALFVLARQHPAEKSLAVIVPMLSDETLLRRVRFRRDDGTEEVYRPQLREVALGLFLWMGKQDLASYGFEYPHDYGERRLTDPWFIANGNAVFRSDEARAIALMKFGWWRLRETVK